MPLPLPVMIPFMMWQSAAIASGFGTMFQYSKRRISAMSNEEFAAANPVDIINNDLDSFIDQMPSSFKKVSAMNPIILDAMLQMLTDAVKWFADILGGQLNTGFRFGEETGSGLPELPENTPFIPGEKGQASIPSVAWLNNLSRDQLKAIRNDALRGDYNSDSTKLILARYKEIFDFDKNASIPESALPGIPIESIKNISSSVAALKQMFPKPKFIPQLIFNEIFKKTSATDYFLYMARIMSSYQSKGRNAKSQTAKILFNNIRTEIQQMIVEMNKILSKNLPFTL